MNHIYDMAELCIYIYVYVAKPTAFFNDMAVYIQLYILSFPITYTLCAVIVIHVCVYIYIYIHTHTPVVSMCIMCIDVYICKYMATVNI